MSAQKSGRKTFNQIKNYKIVTNRYSLFKTRSTKQKMGQEGGVPLPRWKENGNKKILRWLLKHSKNFFFLIHLDPTLLVFSLHMHIHFHFYNTHWRDKNDCTTNKYLRSINIHTCIQQYTQILLMNTNSPSYNNIPTWYISIYHFFISGSIWNFRIPRSEKFLVSTNEIDLNMGLDLGVGKICDHITGGHKFLSPQGAEIEEGRGEIFFPK